ncbi:MAG TPA: MFS transporter [Chitinophagaceae bacterium]|nr:MFS transporter [Chitinophagaceae bacterium]
MAITKTVRILLLGANIWYFGEGMMGPLFAIFAEKVGGDILDITWAWATYLIVTGGLYILVGKLLNNKPYKARVMVAGYVLNAVFTFCYLLVRTPFELLLVQAGLGVAEATGTPAWDAIYAKNMMQESDAYAWGLSTGQAHMVTGIAFGIGGLMVHYVSFNGLFLLMGLVQVLAALVTARILWVR